MLPHDNPRGRYGVRSHASLHLRIRMNVNDTVLGALLAALLSRRENIQIELERRDEQRDGWCAAVGAQNSALTGRFEIVPQPQTAGH